MRLKDMVTLITGSASGLGYAIATRFVEEGANVIINDIDVDRAHKACEQIGALCSQAGQRVTALVADVADPVAVDRMFGAVKARWGRLDVLVNNAGIVIRSPLKFHTDEDWNRVLHVNLDSVFYCSRAAIKLMLPRQWGRVINISSTLGLVGGAHEIAYATAKAGVIGFTKSLAREVGRRNICVNAICPTLAETALTQNYFEDTGVDQRVVAAVLARLACMPRSMNAQDVAHLAVFLASHESAYMNGQALVLDGAIG